jgi:hypothetical protein
MFDFSASDPVDLVEGDQLSVPDGLRRGDVIWLDRVAEHEVVLRVATEAARRTPGVKLYRAERDGANGSIVLRRVNDEAGAGQSDSAHPLSAYAPFFRDTEMAASVLQQYHVGQVLYEPTFCDASYKFGGFVAPHRYLIISASARCLDAFSLHPEWGLCIWPAGRHLKVIDIIADHGHVQVTVLDITEGYVRECNPDALVEIERVLAANARRMFEAALVEAPLPELNTEIWRERLVLPIGIDDQGVPFPCPR